MVAVTADLTLGGAQVAPGNPVPTTDAGLEPLLAALQSLLVAAADDATEAGVAAVTAAVQAVRAAVEALPQTAQTDALTDSQLRATPVPVTTGLMTQTDALTAAQRAAQDPATDTSVQAVTAAVQALPAPQTNALTLAQAATLLPPEAGTWGYVAGTSGTVTPTGRVLAITATAPDSADATLTINGGDTITIPAGRAVTIEPRANLTSPTLVLTGTDAYLVHLLT